MKNSAMPNSTSAATKIIDMRRLMNIAAAMAHTSIIGARMHMRRII